MLDSREAALREQMPDARTAGLAVGDAVLAGRMVVERKTVRDLSASIRDGRWRDQLARLRAAASGTPAEGEPGGALVAIVVEGRLPAEDELVDGVTGGSLRSALAGAFVRDGVPHFATEDVRATAGLLRLLAGRLNREQAPSEQTGRSACGLRLRKRGEALSDPRAVAKAQLAVVPGISCGTASALLGECSSMSDWLCRWAGRGPQLAEVRLSSSGRRLGAKAAQRLLRLLGADEPRPAQGPA